MMNKGMATTPMKKVVKIKEIKLPKLPLSKLLMAPYIVQIGTEQNIDKIDDKPIRCLLVNLKNVKSPIACAINKDQKTRINSAPCRASI